MDNELYSDHIRIERKQFFFDVKENPRGRFLKITEDVGGRRDTVIVPSTGLVLFRDTLSRMIAELGEDACSDVTEPVPAVAAE